MDILLNELQEIQEKNGFISEYAILEISKRRNIPKAHLYGIISFYSRFYTKPKGKYIIRVCKSVACGMNGSNPLLDAIKSYLNISIGETTPNMMFTLEVVECLGHCSEAPVFSINDKCFSADSPEQAVAIIKNHEAG